MTFDARDVIATKRDGRELGRQAIEAFLESYVRGELPDYQAATLLMAIYLRGLEPRELVDWTRAMLESGQRLAIDAHGRPKVDKHSTGGIGDKASLPLAPALAACGVCVPMISGRGLGHTGGTLDKLESFFGLRTELELPHLQRCIDTAGFFIAAQTGELVPADKQLYALRDATATVESIPLIASSIVSKKLAEGLDALVLDVKHGSGAFLPELERAQELADTMVELCRGFGLRAAALLNPMDRPLGRSVGHALEIVESMQCLRGSGPADLRGLVCELGGKSLELVGLARDRADGSARIAASLDDGSALEHFERGVRAQGGDPGTRFERVDVHVVEATRSGPLIFRDLRAIGRAVLELGGGRRKREDDIDRAVGLVFLAEAGERLELGQPMVEVHHRKGAGLQQALLQLESGIDPASLDG